MCGALRVPHSPLLIFKHFICFSNLIGDFFNCMSQLAFFFFFNFQEILFIYF